MIRTGGRLCSHLNATLYSPGGLAIDPAEHQEDGVAATERSLPPPSTEGGVGREGSEEDGRSENG